MTEWGPHPNEIGGLWTVGRWMGDCGLKAGPRKGVFLSVGNQAWV